MTLRKNWVPLMESGTPQKKKTWPKDRKSPFTELPLLEAFCRSWWHPKLQGRHNYNIQHQIWIRFKWSLSIVNNMKKLDHIHHTKYQSGLPRTGHWIKCCRSPPAQPVAHLILGVPGHVCRPQLKRSQFSSENPGQESFQKPTQTIQQGCHTALLLDASATRAAEALSFHQFVVEETFVYKGKDKCIVRSTVPTASLSLLELFQFQEAHRLFHGSFTKNDPQVRENSFVLECTARGWACHKLTSVCTKDYNFVARQE